jgi:hypothetical protein
MDRERAIEKVRKLRALAERPGTEHEGKAARASAARLMLRHGLSDADVAPPPEPKRPRQPARPMWPTGVTVTFNTFGSATGSASMHNSTGFAYVRFG